MKPLQPNLGSPFKSPVRTITYTPSIAARIKSFFWTKTTLLHQLEIYRLKIKNRSSNIGAIIFIVSACIIYITILFIGRGGIVQTPNELAGYAYQDNNIMIMLIVINVLAFLWRSTRVNIPYNQFGM